jgi:DNA-binding NtrC family response regulator
VLRGPHARNRRIRRLISENHFELASRRLEGIGGVARAPLTSGNSLQEIGQLYLFLRNASLGAFPVPAEYAGTVHNPRLEKLGVLLLAHEGKIAGIADLGSDGSRAALMTRLVAELAQGSLNRCRLTELSYALRGETTWLRRLVGYMTLGRAGAALGSLRSAVSWLAEASEAYRGFRGLFLRLQRPHPPVLTEFEDTCREVLEAAEPGRPPAKDPVRRVRRLASALRQRFRTRPRRVMDALDALITIGRSESGRRLRRRAVAKIAAMLGAWVVFYRVDRRWAILRPQANHTLRTTTILRLARVRRLRSFRIRHRPEFWRMDQRRPRGVVVFPIGTGVACIGRDRPFGRRELAAVRTILRFLDARLREHDAAPGGADTARAPTTLAGETLVGESRAWRDVVEQVRRVATSDCGVVLHGETGTGKERVARAIHSASRRSPFEFVAVNCGAVAASLVASELFGHVRGAFTGADRSRTGLVVKAHRGTLFLDEAADMPAEMQVALLRMLEEKTIRPLGSTGTEPADVRVIAASARDLTAEVAAGRFREDLLHRLDVVRIELPPLRQRVEDVPTLAMHLLARTPERARLHPDCMGLLLEHAWPGNVRELENVLRAAAALADGPEITPELLGTLLHRRFPAVRRRSSVPLTGRQKAILRAVGREWLSTPEIATRIGVSVRTTSREVTALVGMRMLESSGEARARRYARAAGVASLEAVGSS